MQKPETSLGVKSIEPKVAVLLYVLEVPNSNLGEAALIEVS